MMKLGHFSTVWIKKESTCTYNGSQLKNPDIFGALYTLRIQYYTQTQCEDGARDVRVFLLNLVTSVALNKDRAVSSYLIMSPTSPFSARSSNHSVVSLLSINDSSVEKYCIAAVTVPDTNIMKPIIWTSLIIWPHLTWFDIMFQIYHGSWIVLYGIYTVFEYLSSLKPCIKTCHIIFKLK